MQWRNSISIICSEQSFSFTDIPLLYSLMHFQTSISLFIINLGMFCLTLSYIPPFPIKALSGEMFSSCLPKTPPPHPFPIKHSCWCCSSVSSPCCSVAWPTPQQPSSWPAAKLSHSAVTWRSPSCRSPSCEAGKQHHKPTSHSPVGMPHRHKRSHRSCCPVAFCSSPSGEGLTRHTDARACGHLGPLIAHWWESLWQTSHPEGAASAVSSQHSPAAPSSWTLVLFQANAAQALSPPKYSFRPRPVYLNKP